MTASKQEKFQMAHTANIGIRSLRIHSLRHEEAQCIVLSCCIISIECRKSKERRDDSIQVTAIEITEWGENGICICDF